MLNKKKSILLVLAATGGVCLVLGLWLISHSLIRWEHMNGNIGDRRAELQLIWSWKEKQVMEVRTAGRKGAIRTLTPSILLPADKTVKLKVVQEPYQILDGQGNRDPKKPGALVRVTVFDRSGQNTISDFPLNDHPADYARDFKELDVFLHRGAVAMSISVFALIKGKIAPDSETFIHMLLPVNPFTILGIPLDRIGGMFVIAGIFLYAVLIFLILGASGAFQQIGCMLRITRQQARLGTVTFLVMFAGAVGSMVLITYIPRSDIRKHIRQGYEQGMLDVNWSLRREVVEGVDPYSDAAIANFALDRNSNRLLTALSPRYSSPDGRPGWDPEKDLQIWVTDPSRMEPMAATNRYWFGHMVISKPLLWIFSIRGVREMLFCMIVFGAIASVWATERFAKSVLTVTACLSVALFTCAGVFQFGKLWVQVPVYLAPWFVIITSLLCYRYIKPERYKVILPIVLGTMSNFMENATGVVLSSLSVFVVIDYFYHLGECGTSRRDALLGTLGRAVLFVVAFVGFIFLKLVLLTVLMGWETTFGAFVTAVGKRTGASESINPWLVIESVTGSARNMVFWGAWFAPAIILLSLAGGVAFFVISMLKLAKDGHANSTAIDYLVLTAPLIITAAWYLVFANHTIEHSIITARSIFLPICFFFVALITFVTSYSRRFVSKGQG